MGSKRPLRVLIVSSFATPHVGGAERVIHELCAGLAARPDYAVTWCANAQENGMDIPGVAYLPLRGYMLIERLTGIRYPLWGPLSLWKLLRAVRNHDIVHVNDHMQFGGLAAVLFSRLLGKKSVITMHGPVWIDSDRHTTIRRLVGAVHRMQGRIIIPSCDAVTVVSDVGARSLERDVKGVPFTIVRNGIDGSVFTPVDTSKRKALREKLGMTPDKPTLLFAGRFVRMKGIETVMRIARRRPDWDVHLVGKPMAPEPVHPSSWNLPNVHDRGPAPDRATLAQFYQSADVLVAPSSEAFEGVSLVALEALACGLPVVMTRKFGYDGVDERLFNLLPESAGDDAWIAAIEGALSTDRGDFARRCTEALRDRQWKNTVDAYTRVYESL